MNLKIIGKLFGLGVALAILALAAGNQGEFSLAQAECTVTLQPGESIQNAIDRASPRAVICVKAGIWTENLTITKGLVLQGAGRDQTTLIGTVSITTADEVALKGFTLAGGRGLSIRDSSAITISDNTISESKGAGLLLSNTAALIEANLITGNTTQGILISFNSDVTLRANVITNNGSDGVEVSASRASLDVNLIKKNRGCGVKADSSSKVEGKDNVITQNQNDLCGVSSALGEQLSPSAPLNLRVDPSQWTNRPITVDWENPSSGSPIVAFWYKIGAEPTRPEDGTRLGIDKKPLVLEYPPEGQHSIFIWLENADGNKSHFNHTQGVFFFDKTPPEIRYLLNPKPNEHGWNKEDVVTVSFECNDGISGIASCTSPVNLTQEVKGQVIKGEAVDRAGNRAEAAVIVNIDRTKPVIKISSPQGKQGREGWYISDVEVTFSATDNLAGFPPKGDLTLEVTKRTGEGKGVLLTFEITDLAGNKAEATAGPFNVDWTPPSGSLTINGDKKCVTQSLVTLQIQAADNLSGLAEMRFSNDGKTWSEWESFKEARPNWSLFAYGGNKGEGLKTVWAQLNDRAGNISNPFSQEIFLVPSNAICVPDEFSTIQKAIDAVKPGTTIYVAPGTYIENLLIAKGLTLRGVGQDKSIVKGAKEGYPVIRIESDSEVEVILERLTIAEAKGTECAVKGPQWICPNGIQVRDKAKAKVTIKDSTISGNGDDGLHVYGYANVSLTNSTVSGNGSDGLEVRGSANVSLVNSTVSGNWYEGLYVWDSANVSLQDSTISGNGEHGLSVLGSANVSLVNSTVSGNGWDGLIVSGSANVSLQDSTVSGNRWDGLDVRESANVSLVNSTVSGNGGNGLSVWDSAKATIKGSTIEKNGTREDCAKADRICNGILVDRKSQTTIIDSIIRNNTDWGVAAELKKCGYKYNTFTGKVIFQGNNQIYGNGQGDVCLP